jgi:peptidoglycan/LPS O-acetylase OafA/YrhL
VAAYFLMPDALWNAQLVHALASILFVENWWLAREATDYLQRGLTTSPFQQMWALSLQMQVYLVFPLLYLLASGVARLFRAGPRAAATVVFGAVFAASLLFSIGFTTRDQSVAYFVTPTRLWEFAAGALLALWIGRIRLAPLVAKLLGWAGLIVLVALGIMVDVSRAFPGYLAGIPVFAALAIIVAAANGGNLRLLNNRLMTGAADASFAFYLWHWPVLIFMRYSLGSDDVGIVGGAVVLVVAAVLAWLSTRLVETPVRRWSWLAPRPVLSIAVSLLILLVPSGAVFGWAKVLQGRVDAALVEWSALHASATPTVPPGVVVPAPVMLPEDRPGTLLRLCNQSRTGRKLLACEYGDPNGRVTIVSVGGSHVGQWTRALHAVGLERGYRFVNMTKDGCTFTSGTFQDASCPVWNEAAMAAIIDLKPDLVFAMATRVGRRDWMITSEGVTEGYRRAFATLAENGIDVLGVRDNPWFGFHVPQCVSASASPWTECGRAQAGVLDMTSPFEGVDAPNVHFVDLTDLYCTEGFCPAVKDGVLVYRDKHHLTRTFTFLNRGRVADAIEAALAKAAGR